MPRMNILEPGHLLSPMKNLVSIKSGLFVLLVVLTTLAFKQGNKAEILLSVGDRWQKETLVAESPFPLYKSDDSLRAERKRMRETVEPVFYSLPAARQETREAADSIIISMERVFDVYTDYRIGIIQDRRTTADDPAGPRMSESTIEDSLESSRLRLEVPVLLNDSIWDLLGQDYVQRSPEIRTEATVSPDTPPLFEVIMNAIANRSQRLQLQGVLDIPADSVYTSHLIVRDTLDNTFERRPVTGVIDQNEAGDRIRVWLEEMIFEGDSLITPESVIPLIQAVLRPSLAYQSGPTEQRRREAEAQILPVRGMVNSGEEIVRNGELITPEIKQKLDSLEREQGGGIPAHPSSRLQLMGQVLFALIVISIFALFLRSARQSIFADNKSVILLSVLYAGTVIAFGTVIRIAPAEFMYAVPVVIVSVLLTVIFDSRLALWGTLILALIGGFLLNSDFTYTLTTLVGGAVAIVSARDLRNRGQLFLTAAYAFGGYALALSTIWLHEGNTLSQLQEQLLFAGVGSFLLVTAYPFLWVLERVFGVATDLRLLELSDTNHPLLRELMKNAPGTCNHSIQVSSLAGSVADEIGANTLLTRVGALYHDVGKLSAPEYFIENQTGEFNPHEELPPAESAQIIISHVTRGLELGERYRLPARVLHLIASHHGTTRTEYFFQKAVEESEADGSALGEDSFIYPGPKPGSKEAGILMLTDTVEAASRTMQEVTEEKLRDMVSHLIASKVEEGQLDDTGLTFRDIAYIKKVLIEQLLAIHHTRVSYPAAGSS